MQALSAGTPVPLGLTGAVAATRFVGGNTQGAPVAGTFKVGDFCINQDGTLWVCTAAGSPGTWQGQQPSPFTTGGDTLYAALTGYGSLTSAGSSDTLPLTSAGGLSGLTDSAAGTYELWFKTTGSGVGLVAAGSGAAGVIIGFNSGLLNLTSYDGIHGTSYNFNADPRDGNWHHLVVSIASGSASVYIDGQALSVHSAFLTAQWYVGSAGGTLAAAFGPTAQSFYSTFTGSIAECAFYRGVALTQARAQAHFNAASPSAYSAAVLADSPTRYWRCGDSGVANVAADSSGAGATSATVNGTFAPNSWVKTVTTSNPGAYSRLPIGSVGQVYQVSSSGLPAWGAVPGGVNPPITATTDIGLQPNSVTNSALTVHNAASAVNLLTLTGTATGTDPTLVVSGDANRGLVINPAGTGTITVGAKSNTGIPLTIVGNSTSQTGNLLSVLQNSGGNSVLTVATVASAVNGVTITGAANASSVAIAATSSTGDTPGLLLRPAGTGAVTVSLQSNSSAGFLVNSASGTILTVAPSGAAVNGVTVTGTATGVAPSIAATGTDSSISLTIDGKAGGSVSLGTVSTGNVIIGNGSQRTTIKVSNGTGLLVIGNAGTALSVFPIASGVNGIQVAASATGIAPSVTATGTDTNIDLTIAGQGTGRINYGYAGSAISGAAAPATLAATTGGATGPGTAAQNQWLAVKINGTVNYIPVWQ